MKLAKAIQIAIEAINLQRLELSPDAIQFKFNHVDTWRTRACSELYQTYSDAINLLNSLVSDPAPAAYHAVTMDLATETFAQPDHVVTTPAPGPLPTQRPLWQPELVHHLPDVDHAVTIPEAPALQGTNDGKAPAVQGDYKSARGVIPYETDGETTDELLRRSRDELIYKDIERTL